MRWLYALEAQYRKYLKERRRARHFRRLREMSVAFGAGFSAPRPDEQHRRLIAQEATRHAHAVKEGT